MSIITVNGNQGGEPPSLAAGAGVNLRPFWGANLINSLSIIFVLWPVFLGIQLKGVITDVKNRRVFTAVLSHQRIRNNLNIKKKRERERNCYSWHKGSRDGNYTATNQGRLRASRSWKRQRRLFPSSLRKRHSPASTLILNFWPPELLRG